MSMVFRFTMLSDENDEFVREYEVNYDMSLIDFHDFICSDLKFDANQMTSFFTSNREWEKLHEYTLFDMGAEMHDDGQPTLPMEGMTLGILLRQNHDRLIYLFDFLNERALYLELMATLKSDPSAVYPRCTAAVGEAPGQFEAAATGDHSIFDEVMSDFNDFEGDDSYDDDL